MYKYNNTHMQADRLGLGNCFVTSRSSPSCQAWIPQRQQDTMFAVKLMEYIQLMICGGVTHPTLPQDSTFSLQSLVDLRLARSVCMWWTDLNDLQVGYKSSRVKNF